MSDKRRDEPITDAPQSADDQETPAQERVPDVDRPRPSQAEGDDEDEDVT